VEGGCVDDAEKFMQYDQDVRDVLLAIQSLLKSVPITARSPNFEAVRDIVELALSEPGNLTQPMQSAPNAGPGSGDTLAATEIPLERRKADPHHGEREG
jgi:hypothetical protein